jgi:prophage antirepressor-like protein
LSNELTVVKSELFGNVLCDFYRVNENIFMTRRQIGEALDYADPQKAIGNLHAKHSDRLDKYSVHLETKAADGKCYDTCFYTVKGIYEICRWSRQAKADDFIDWAWDVIEAIRTTGHYETIANEMAVIEAKLHRIESNLIFQKYDPPKPKLVSLEVRFCCAVKMDRHTRRFYDAIQDYTGIHIPKASELPKNIKVYEYIFEHINLDDIESFVVGVEQGLIVKSDKGHWVNLNGYDNPVEWRKILDAFDHRCAYCGADEPLVAEHIIPQSEISMYEPEKTSLIGNVIPACPTCNHSKLTHPMENWYRHQAFFDEARLTKIQEHIENYSLGGIQ